LTDQALGGIAVAMRIIMEQVVENRASFWCIAAPKI
jgi:hypothetical protein